MIDWFKKKHEQFGDTKWGRRLLDLIHHMGRDKVGVVSAGLAFYALLGLFPGLVALLSIAGLFLDEDQVESQLEFITEIIPGGAGELITDQLAPIAQTGGGLLSLGIIIGLAGAIWSLSGAMGNLFAAMQLAYDVKQPRNFLINRGLAIVFAIAALAGALLMLVGLVFVPVVAGELGLGPIAGFLLEWGRWPLLVAVVFISFLVVYRFGIRRKHVRWRTLLWGAAAGTGIWVLASVGFAVYINYFADYTQFYGALSTVIILLMWFLLSGFAIIIGAELNAVLLRERTGRADGNVHPEEVSQGGGEEEDASQGFGSPDDEVSK